MPTILHGWNAVDNGSVAANWAAMDAINGHPVLSFRKTDGSTNLDESAAFSGFMPAHYNGSGVSVYIVWCAELSDDDTQNVVWQAAFERLAVSAQNMREDGFATGKTVISSVPSQAGVIRRAVITFDASEIDGLQAGELFRLKITRLGTSEDDTLTDADMGRALLVIVTLEG